MILYVRTSLPNCLVMTTTIRIARNSKKGQALSISKIWLIIIFSNMKRSLVDGVPSQKFFWMWSYENVVTTPPIIHWRKTLNVLLETYWPLTSLIVWNCGWAFLINYWINYIERHFCIVYTIQKTNRRQA